MFGSGSVDLGRDLTDLWKALQTRQSFSVCQEKNFEQNAEFRRFRIGIPVNILAETSFFSDSPYFLPAKQ